MLSRTVLIAPVLLSCLSLPLLAKDLRSLTDSPPKFHTEEIDSNSRSYTVEMGGGIDGEMTRDPVGYWAYDQYWEPNVFVRLENVGKVPLVNPWLRRADRPDTRTVKGLVDFVTRPGMSDEEKARRLWEFEIKQRFHATTEDMEVNDVVKLYNCYGYTLCYDESRIMSDLWRTAGLKVRKGYPNGHSTAEVFYKGDWHLLDSDEGIICLLRDNKTIASEAQIVADHDLMKRTHTYGPLHDDNRLGDEGGAALCYWEGERSGEHESLTSHTMDFTLRPGEALTWAWNPANRFHGKAFQNSETESYYWNKRWRLIAHVMNGELSYDADLSDKSTLEYFRTSGVELQTGGPFGAGLYLRGDSGSVILTVASPYPVVGGRLDVDFNRGDLDRESVRVLLSFDDGENWREVWTGSGFEYARMYIDLNEFFPAHDPARYKYLLRFDFLSKAAEPLVCLKHIYLRSTLQMAQLALPGVSLGKNTFIYSDQSPAGSRARLTHSWQECSAVEIPGKPAAALYPPNGGVAQGTLFTFQWQPPAGGTAPTDYEFQLSEYPDLRWALSPNFHKLIGRTANRNTASYSLPCTGLLNPGETCYWRVRARSREGVWGPWSNTFSFKALAPAVPLEPSVQLDRAARSARLLWKPGAGGNPPARYRVYGSAERGFTASDSAYRSFAGLEGIRENPPNLLFETPDPQTAWDIPPESWRPYYRVVALDAGGRQSGSSETAELAHPLIVTGTLPPGRPGGFYEAKIEVSASSGHLVSQDEDGKAYQMRYRGGDELFFKLGGAPEALSIGRKTGLISGYLPSSSAGRFALTVSVADERTGASDSKSFEFEVKGAMPGGPK